MTHGHPAAPVAWRAGGPVSAGTFLADVQRLAARLPVDGPMLNLCVDRYHFSVALAACLMRGIISLLPPAQAPQPLAALPSAWPGLGCLTDAGSARTALALQGPGLRVDMLAAEAACPAPGAWSVPSIRADQPAAILFTSGSTGEPVAHAKDYGSLIQAVRAGAARLAAVGPAGCAMLGTVPPQHMFGLEATVLLPLQDAGLVCAERPMFPADIAAALARLPRPRALCSTPVHLRALLDSGVELPGLDLVVCATSPLPRALARAVEAQTRAPLLEIYGSTETGQMASRRPADEATFRLWPGLRLTQQARGWQVRGGHLAAPITLADHIEPLDPAHFLLRGRTADLVNIAGRRSSLAYLTHQLCSIPGVSDGAFFIPGDAPVSATGVVRLAAIAVAPQLDAASLMAALRSRIDAVFLPRPLLLVERLPRDAAGKLPRQALATLLEVAHG